MDKVSILGKDYIYVDKIEKISIADSFVLSPNKIGGGNGEAKLYVGQVGDLISNFFGERGFVLKCFLLKSNLIKYLDSAYSEYAEPSQQYREREALPQKWEQRTNKVNELDTFILFEVKDQNQILGPRVYLNSIETNTDKSIYSLLRELSLPIITHLNIYKFKSIINDEIKYFFSIFLNGADDNIEDYFNQDIEIDKQSNKFVPSSDDNVDIEKEIFSIDDAIINSPFDPNKIKVRTTPSTIGQIINDLEDHIINLNTEFQRLPNLWNNDKKSRFIESLLLKLPIPAFYFNEKEENDLEVIDGLQRISTIKSFVINDDFELQNLEFLKEYNGNRFIDLPSTFQRRIKTFPITTYIIEKGTPNDVKYNIFKRVNTGGLMLTEQEIRHAINQGLPSELVADLARGNDEFDDENVIKERLNHDKTVVKLYATREGKEFIKATDNRIGTHRMEDRDFITRFISFYLIPYNEYEPNLDTFLNNGMTKIRELNNEEIQKVKDDFYKAMELSFHIFKNDAFRKRLNKFDGRKPINKALFEVLSVSFAKLSELDIIDLKKSSNIFMDKFIELNNNYNFLSSISQGTAQKERVIKRFVEIEKIIKETLENDK
jgi:hypothetical protein